MDNKEDKSKIKIGIVIAALLIVIILCAIAISFTQEKKDLQSSISSSREYIENAVKPCHSTLEHKNMIVQYDLNKDGRISTEELKAFAADHKQVVFDEEFIEWLKSLAEE